MARAFVVWISIFPFIMLYGAYEGPKVWWLWTGGCVLSLWWIIQQRKPRGSWFLMWICVLLLASLMGVHPFESILGGGYRHQGILFFLTIFLIGETVSLLSIKQKSVLMRLLAWGVLLESSIVIFQKITDWQMRPLGTFGEPNAVAGFLAIGLFWIMPRKKIFDTLFVCLAILSTGSRSAILAASIVLIAGSGMKKYFIAVLAIAAVLLISSTRPASPYENRPLFWQMAAKAIAQKPFFGYGAESSEVVFNETFAREHIRLFDFTIERSHNIFLDIAMWSGFVGLVVFCRWVWGMFRSSKKPWVIAAWLFFACLQPVGVVHWIQLILLASLYI